MTATLTESEEEAPTPLTAAEAFKITAARETTLARMWLAGVGGMVWYFALQPRSHDKRGYVAEGEWEVRPQRTGTHG